MLERVRQLCHRWTTQQVAHGKPHTQLAFNAVGQFQRHERIKTERRQWGSAIDVSLADAEYGCDLRGQELFEERRTLVDVGGAQPRLERSAAGVVAVLACDLRVGTGRRDQRAECRYRLPVR